MKDIAKRALAAFALVKTVGWVRRMRRPEPSPLARAGKATAFLAGAGGLFYLFKSGRLAPLLQRLPRAQDEGRGVHAPSAPLPGGAPEQTVTLEESVPSPT